MIVTAAAKNNVRNGEQPGWSSIAGVVGLPVFGLVYHMYSSVKVSIATAKGYVAMVYAARASAYITRTPRDQALSNMNVSPCKGT